MSNLFRGWTWDEPVNLPPIKKKPLDHVRPKFSLNLMFFSAYGFKVNYPIYRDTGGAVHYHQSLELDRRTTYDCSGASAGSGSVREGGSRAPGSSANGMRLPLPEPPPRASS
jgi:hypothetical protein